MKKILWWFRSLFFGSWRMKYFASAPGVYVDGETGRERKAAAFFTIEENDKGEQRAFIEIEGQPRRPCAVAEVLVAFGVLMAKPNKTSAGKPEGDGCRCHR